MIQVRRDADIHDVEGGWFRARWHFSFDRYRDPENDGFGAMRVFNDDRLIPGAEVGHELGPGRGAYVYLIAGAASFDGEEVSTGDAAKVTEQSELRIRAIQRSELILVDVPMSFVPVGVWAVSSR
jgi:redox-sensitive bicupin YhaK (pirin superfamily)